MKFDKSRVYTALNADELKVDSKVIVANTIDELKRYVEDYCEGLSCTVDCIMPEYFSDRFYSDDKYYNFAYLIEESKPEEKVLKWTDLKIGDIIRTKDGSETALVIRIYKYSQDSHINIGHWLRDADIEKYWEKE